MAVQDATSAPLWFSWFNLSRHDADPAPPDPQPDDPAEPEDEEAERLLADAVDKDGKGEDYWKRRARENERRAKENAAKAKKLDELEAANQTEAEKREKAREAAEKRAEQATARAVRAEVKALADDFADREDAVLNLGDLTKYVVDDGEIDTEAIKSDLESVLGRKQHLRKAVGPRNPAPDPSQGRGGDNKPTDFRTADKAAFDAELAKYGLRPQSRT